MNLIDTQDRGKLSEGRTSGIGFGFCKKDGDNYLAIMPLSSCKEYLNDVVWAEATGKSCTAWGLTATKQGTFDNGVFMAMGILPINRTTTKRADHDELEKALMSPQMGLESFLSHFETKLGVSATRFEKVALNRIVATLDPFWVKALYRISLWSLLVRVGLKYREGDPLDFLRKMSDQDALMVKAAIPKIEKMMGGQIPEEDLTKITSPHGMGIQAFAWPK